ncbi:uncharacterized protein LOC144144289 [Haemaphysalis longicornis]
MAQIIHTKSATSQSNAGRALPVAAATAAGSGGVVVSSVATVCGGGGSKPVLVKASTMAATRAFFCPAAVTGAAMGTATLVKAEPASSSSASPHAAPLMVPRPGQASGNNKGTCSLWLRTVRRACEEKPVVGDAVRYPDLVRLFLHFCATI